MAITFHAFDEVDVRNTTDDLWVHGIVHEALPLVVWVSLDNVVLDVPVDPSSNRIRIHEVTS